jgi:hypothetical protein
VRRRRHDARCGVRFQKALAFLEDELLRADERIVDVSRELGRSAEQRRADREDVVDGEQTGLGVVPSRFGRGIGKERADQWMTEQVDPSTVDEVWRSEVQQRRVDLALDEHRRDAGRRRNGLQDAFSVIPTSSTPSILTRPDSRGRENTRGVSAAERITGQLLGPRAPPLGRCARTRSPRRRPRG